MLPVVVLAGGLARRLGAVSAETPKVLVDVAGRPFAEYQLDWMRREGVVDVVYAVGHLGEQVVTALGDGSRWGLRVRYVFDGPQLLGTGGALRHAMALTGSPAFVLYGDSYLTCSLSQVEAAWRQSGCACLMTVFRNEGRWDSSNVEFADGRIVTYDKQAITTRMRYIDYGLGIVSASALLTYPADQPFDLASAYRDQLAVGQLAGFEVQERFYEIGSPAGLAEARAHLSRRVLGE